MQQRVMTLTFTLNKEYQKLQDPNLNLCTLFINNISEGYFVYD